MTAKKLNALFAPLAEVYCPEQENYSQFRVIHFKRDIIKG